MPNTTGYIVHTNNTWKAKGVTSTAHLGANNAGHAERKAYANLNSNGPYLLVQDAFPCYDHCHAHFLAESRAPHNRSIIIKVLADGTMDMAAFIKFRLIPMPLPARVEDCFPFYIYYHGGLVSVRWSVPNPPVGFPAHPSPQNADL